MRGRWTASAWCCLLAIGLFANIPLWGAPPWLNLIPLRPGSGKSQQTSIYLSEEDGPWMILAAAFRGEGAEEDATELARELRRDFKLPAYIHRQHYDFTEPVQGLGVDRYNQPKKMRYMQAAAFDEIAVLVGNFQTLEDPAVHDTLERLKYARPGCLSGQAGHESTLRFASLRRLQRVRSGDEKRKKGPMGNAFVTRNPLLPREYFAPRGIDPLVVDMNRGVKYSLLDCPGRYSVRIATFRGEVVIDQRKLQQIEAGEQKLESRLEDAAVKANKLTLALRAKGVEAFEFHDRTESIVTVGSFDSIGSSGPDGQFTLHPRVEAIVHHFAASQQPLPSQVTPHNALGLQPKSLNGIPFDLQPVPVQVPRRSIATDYVR